MSFLDEAETLLKGSSVAGPECVGVILTATSTEESVFLGADATTSPSLAYASTAQVFFLAASSSGVEIAETSNAEAFYLTDQAPVWVIYKSHMPDSTALNDRAVALLETMGGGVMGRIEMETPTLQVLVRGAPMHEVSTAYPEAEDKMDDLIGALHEYTGSALTTTYWAGVWCSEGPTFEGFDESWRPTFGATFRVMRATT